MSAVQPHRWTIPRQTAPSPPERGARVSPPGPLATYEDDVLFLEWSADAAATSVEDGIDTFVFRDGLIRVQTVRYTLQRKS